MPRPPEPQSLAVDAVARLTRSGHATPAVRGIARDLARDLSGTPGTAVQLAAALVAAGERHLAYEILNALPEARRRLRPRDLEVLGEGLEEWGYVDAFGCFVLGPAWRDGQVSDAWVERCARSADRWRRRTAVVATVPLNAKSRGAGAGGDAPRTLAVVSLVTTDRDPMVVKAVSWALRTLAACDRGAVERFLATNAGTLAPLVLREVRRKLETGRKNARRSPSVAARA